VGMGSDSTRHSARCCGVCERLVQQLSVVRIQCRDVHGAMGKIKDVILARLPRRHAAPAAEKRVARGAVV
jgi:hypothetical protein